MSSSVPTPAEQIYFLQNTQRLLAEGQFVASYKFALIRALADLAVLMGEDTDAPLDQLVIDPPLTAVYWQTLDG